MKKKTDFVLRVMAFLCVCFISLTTRATTVTAVYNSNSGIKNAYYIATLGDGTVLGFSSSSRSYTNSKGESVQYYPFVGAITSATSLVVPDSVMINNTTYIIGVVNNSSLDLSQAPNLSSISFPSAEYVGQNAFYNCTSLTSISLPAATSIGSSAFENCTSLTSISLPAATSIGSSAFRYCTSLTSISLPAATSIDSRAFNNCTSLTSISLPATVSISSNAFSGVDNLKDVYIIGDTIATWDPDYLYLGKAIVWVPQSLYNEYRNSWIIGKGIDVRYEGWEPLTVDVMVNTEGQMGSQILSQVNQWTDVEKLVVKGHLNSNDMKYFASMGYLRQIDLSQTDITSITGCSGLQMLHEVVLPSTVKTVGKEAFYNCKRLTDINLPSATNIGESAFSGCVSLDTVSCPSVITIGSYAFYSCSSLASIDLPAVTSISSNAFYNCSSLASIDLPAATSIGSSAFYSCRSLTSIDLPAATSIGDRAFSSCNNLASISLPVATSIGSSAFSACSSLTSIDLPAVTSIGSSAFFSCSSLASITLPATLENLAGNCFVSSGLQDIYCHAAVPFPTSAFNSGFPSGVTLHVPAFSVTAYKTHTDWGNNMASIVAMDGTIDEIKVNTDFTITDLTGLAEKVNLTVESCMGDNIRSGHLDILSVQPWQIGKLSFENYKRVTGYHNGWTYPYCNSMITQSEVSADEVELSFCVQTDEWNFISFPFDVKVADIEWPNHTLWAIRKYSGADRAALTGNTWQDITSEMTLQAGEGYILQCTNDSINDTGFWIKIHAVDNNNKNRIFTTQDVAQPLSVYDSEYAYNRSWNLVGNPYPSYFNSKEITHNGVITAWNGSGYTAYSLTDDQYVMRPFEAFFVQCPADEQQMTFKTRGRQHTLTTDDDTSPAPALMPSATATDRRVFNFVLAGNDNTDRTRLVINEQAKADYEIACDASKMMSHVHQAAQLYLTDGGIRYAIDERPLGTGVFQLGMRIGEAGNYTLQLQANQMEGCTVVLKDQETGRQADLTEESYTFTEEAGSIDNRFTVTLGGDVTGISNVNVVKDHDAKWFSLDGKQVKSGAAPGVYIMNKNGVSRKVVVTK